MHHRHERFQGLTAAIFGLWRNWAVAVGLLALLAFVSPLVPRLWILPMSVGAYVVLTGIRMWLRQQKVPSCARFLQEVSTVLLVNCLALVAIALDKGGVGGHELTGQPIDAATPFITELLIEPVTALVTLWFLLRPSEPLTCSRCKLRYGSVIEHGFVGGLYRQEWRYQTRLLFTISLFLTVVSWGYFLVRYSNVNLNRADHFYFVWMPMVVYLLSLVYLGMRYFSMWLYFCHNDEQHYIENPGTTTWRYLIFCQGDLLLDLVATTKKYDNGASAKCFDTPAIATTPYRATDSQFEADALFRQITGLTDFHLRRIYDSPDPVTFRNTFHYFAFIPDRDAIPDSKIGGEWLGREQVRQIMAQGLGAQDLVSELERVYRVSMAWKTYDRQGRRLYPIRNYRPTFRFADLKDWDVDYGDAGWLRVYHHNQDKPLFWVTNLWDKCKEKLSPL